MDHIKNIYGQRSAENYSEDNTEPNLVKGQWKTKHPVHIYFLEKNSTAEPGIEFGTSWSVDNAVNTEPNGRTLIAFLKFKQISGYDIIYIKSIVL